MKRPTLRGAPQAATFGRKCPNHVLCFGRRSIAPPSLPQAAKAVRARRGVENSLRWVLDVDFNDDRLRKGHGAHDMAVVRHFVITIAQSAKSKRSF